MRVVVLTDVPGRLLQSCENSRCKSFDCMISEAVTSEVNVTFRVWKPTFIKVSGCIYSYLYYPFFSKGKLIWYIFIVCSFFLCFLVSEFLSVVFTFCFKG